MLSKTLRVLFGSKNDRELKRMGKLVNKINALEDTMEALSNEDLREKTSEFKQRVASGEILDAILCEAFAACREASKRTTGLRHFDVQLIGGITLHEGRIAEMRTGEGKTLMSTLAAYLNALSGKGVHIVTVNDYLASRDAEWMRPIYEALGLKVGTIKSMQNPTDKHQAYRADVTYGTNNEFGFDYLRDNMALRKDQRMQRPLNFAVVDEVDSILIDEARTPLIISGQAEDSSELYRAMNKLIPKLKRVAASVGERNEKIVAGKVMISGEGAAIGINEALHRAESGNKDLVILETGKVPVCQLAEKGHYEIDEKTRQAELTETGHEIVEDWLRKSKLIGENESLYGAGKLGLMHHVHSALRAHTLFNRDVEYIVQDNQIILIDEHTGRTMPGRRLSEGLHQAIEAKEGVQINAESQTLASTTFQNYFRIYPKLSGMTGTADTEAFEFKQIYGLDVVVIPTNVAIQRQDLNDLVFLSIEEKYDAICRDVKAYRDAGAPVLVGTASVETSEEMSKRLKKAGIAHEVLNAKYHEKEADIIAQAGRPGAVTIATNMAGRGTDIVLGGKWEAERDALGNPSDAQVSKLKVEWEKRHQQVIAAGGLHIIGTERHESRRIDNQLRGRAGRQGDPGMSCFYLSMEDNLMRIFASDRVRGFMQSLGMEKGEAIEHRMVSNAIERAQRKVESRNFDYRKQVLEYDDVANDQRRVVYAQRNELLEAENISDAIAGIRDEVVQDVISQFIPPQSVEEQWDVPALENHLSLEFGVKLPVTQWLAKDKSLHEESLREKISQEVDQAYVRKSERIGDVMAELERQVMLQVLDNLWKEHLQSMDFLRQSIGLRAYAQKNPKQEYKRESFGMFQTMLDNLKFEVTKMLFRVEPMSKEEMEALERERIEAARQQDLKMQHDSVSAMDEPKQQQEANKPQPYVRAGSKVGRNDPCPCGSGKKYKQCHGAIS